MGGIGRKSQFKGQGLAVNLPQLQNLIKRDANSYKPEFLQQWRHWESQLEIFKLGSATASSVSLSSSAVNSTSSVVAAPPSSANTAPSSEGQDFGNLALFLAHVSSCYPEETKSFPTQIIDLLEQHQSILSPDVRFVLVQTLILLRNKSLVSSQALLPVFFKLFRCPDKALRQLLHKHIVSDVKSGNAKGKNNKLNKTFQNFMYTMLKDSSEV